MPEVHETDYHLLINRVIPEFRPVKRLWPIGIRLLLWILLELAIFGLGFVFVGSDAAAVVYSHSYGLDVGAFLLISAIAAWMALRNSVPGRETSAAEFIILGLGAVGAIILARRESLSPHSLPLNELPIAFAIHLSFAGLPWIGLFWGIRRAVSFRPRLTGALIGGAASSFAIGVFMLSGYLYPFLWELLAGTILTGLSAIAGTIWLDPQKRWRKEKESSRGQPHIYQRFESSLILPAATAAAVALLVLALRLGSSDVPVSDFDLTIAEYQQSLAGFRPNVPANSVDTLLAAYIERGMPSYMWDFGPEGLKLVGGRFEHLSDGTPITYTLFRGPKGAMICMFRGVGRFEAPRLIHIDRGHLLFYRYRGFSICLVNVASYTDFIGVIASPMPLQPFIAMVVASLSGGSG
jgi:predicted anti-sigma-YlaC factor YlaD